VTTSEIFRTSAHLLFADGSQGIHLIKHEIMFNTMSNLHSYKIHEFSKLGKKQ
jgi:hypothetical protein